MDKLLESVLNKIKYKLVRFALVKPLPDEYVEKEITKPVTTDKKDEYGYNITDSETVTEKVLTDFCKGILLAMPEGYEYRDGEKLEVGDTVIYKRMCGMDFDLFKNSKLILPYDFVAFIKAADYNKSLTEEDSLKK